MAIPEEFNGSIELWINQVVGDLSGTMNDVQILKKHAETLNMSNAQKTAIRQSLRTALQKHKAEINLIIPELDSLF